ncbi:MAG: hypothetical protein LBV71_15615 [Prevotella sp.]|jgi:hypothetical protein|nr:hypothetical protein [Prevotella sp.]
MDNSEESNAYRFYSIMWKLDDGDGLEVLDYKTHEVFYNNENKDINIVFESMEEVEDYSYFHETENAELLKKLLGKDSIVSIPSEYNYLFSDYSSFSGTEAPLRIGEKVKLHPLMAAASVTRLPPNCKLTQDRTVYQDKITATYSIRFVSKKDWFDYKEIQGKWTGVFFRDIEENPVVEEIGVE